MPSYNKSLRLKLKQERDSKGRFIKAIDSEMYKIMLEEMRTAYDEAIEETPKDTGDLRRGVKFNIGGGGKTTPIIVATASSVHNGYDYAEIQHERTWYHHKIGKDHYISDPFERMVARIEERFDELGESLITLD